MPDNEIERDEGPGIGREVGIACSAKAYSSYDRTGLRNSTAPTPLSTGWSRQPPVGQYRGGGQGRERYGECIES